MCRWLAYSGSPVMPEELIYKRSGSSMIRRLPGARRRPDRARGAQPRHRAPDSDDGRCQRRRQCLGVPLLEHGAIAFALLLEQACDTAGAISGRGSSSPSRSAISRAPGTRCRSRATASSITARTSSGSSIRGRARRVVEIGSSTHDGRRAPRRRCAGRKCAMFHVVV